MKFRNYCIVVLGDTKGVKAEIEKISETELNTMDGGGLFIATFSSLSEPNELREWFIENKRNFLVFDLNEESSGVNFTDNFIHNGLFGFLETTDIKLLDKKFKDVIESSGSTIQTMVGTTAPQNKLAKAKIMKMGVAEKKELLDELIDFGLEKLTDHDKELLPLLAV